MQEIRIEGYVGQDPQIKESNGRRYAQFNVGCSSKTNRRDNNGNDIYATTWYTVYCTPAEASGIFKGTRVLVTGMPKYSTYIDRNEMVQIQININFAKIYISTYASEKQSQTDTTGKQAQLDSKGKATTNQKQEPKQEQATIDNVEPMEEDDGLPF